jgi:hypothetical protein
MEVHAWAVDLPIWAQRHLWCRTPRLSHALRARSAENSARHAGTHARSTGGACLAADGAATNGALRRRTRAGIRGWDTYGSVGPGDAGTRIPTRLHFLPNAVRGELFGFKVLHPFSL